MRKLAIATKTELVDGVEVDRIGFKMIGEETLYYDLNNDECFTAKVGETFNNREIAVDEEEASEIFTKARKAKRKFIFAVIEKCTPDSRALFARVLREGSVTKILTFTNNVNRSKFCKSMDELTEIGALRIFEDQLVYREMDLGNYKEKIKYSLCVNF